MSEATAVRPRPPRAAARGLAGYALFAIGAGVVGGTMWRAVVKLPTYRLDDAAHALISERGLAAIFSADAWFAAIGLITGLVLGAVAFVFFRSWGWRGVLVAFAAAVLAALICWGIGTVLGPGPLQLRLAEAAPGDRVPIDFRLHAASTLAVWPFGAMIPILAASAVLRDPELPVSDRAERDGPPAA